MNPLSTKLRYTTTVSGLAAALLAVFAQGPLLAGDMPTKGVTPYVTHFVFRPVIASTSPVSVPPPRSRRPVPPRT